MYLAISNKYGIKRITNMVIVSWNQSETAKYFERIIIHMQNLYVQHFPKQYHRKVLLSSFSLNGENLGNLNPPTNHRNCYQLFSIVCITRVKLA